MHKSYQSTDAASSAVTTKVKGQGFLPMNMKRAEFFNNPELFTDALFSARDNIQYMQLDTCDYVIPPNEFNSIFIMTNFIKTKQSRNTCEEVTW